MKNKIMKNSNLISLFINNKKIFLINVITIILIFTIGIIFIQSYPKINEAGLGEEKDRLDGYTQTKEFDDDFSKITFVLYKEALESIQGKEIQASDIYVKPESEFESSNDYNVLKDKVNDYLKDWKKDFENNFLNIDYVVLDNSENIIKSNNHNLNELVKSNNINDLKDKYCVCFSIKFDENGESYGNKIYSTTEFTICHEFLLRSLVYTDNYDIVKPMKNVTFIYGINKNLKYNDKISTTIDMENHRYENVTYLYTMILSVAIIILGLVIPHKLENEITLCKKSFKIPFEIIFVLIISFVAAIASSAPDVIRDNIEGSFTNVILSETLKIDGVISNAVVYLLNLLYWSAYITIIFISVVILKNIFYFGLIKYLKERTLIGIIIRSIKRNVQILYNNIDNAIHEIDLTDKSNKLIIKIVSVNAIAILTFLIVWLIGTVLTGSLLVSAFLGILLAFSYCIIMFNLLKQYVNKIKNKYKVLFNTTNKIAEESLDVDINEDLGLFNPLKEQLVRIQKSFKKAVEEEVKSQMMKTELISNVSHDLKTPLTSIITYVDLLKNENITIAERKSYIDTLDKKSQRLKLLIEDLFEVSKATSGNITLNLVKVDIVELMKQTQFELEDKISKANVKIKNNFPENKVILELDSQKTYRVFENLLINVSKYAMNNSRVYVDITEIENHVEIIIKNISAEEIKFDPFDIVERFQRGDKSRNTEGSGLGLAIVKSFVEAQGGIFNIEVDGDLFKVIILF